MGYVSEVWRVEGHGREVLSGAIVRPVLIRIVIGDLRVASPRRGSGGSSRSDFDYQGFFNRLAARIVGVEGGTDGFFRAERTLRAYVLVGQFTGDDLESDVGSIDAAAQGIGIFVQNDIADAID